MSLPEAVQNLIGSDVRATLSLDPLIVIEGTLVSADEYGETVIDTPQGRRNCWPLLEVELL